jgi:hypothetical protein
MFRPLRVLGILGAALLGASCTGSIGDRGDVPGNGGGTPGGGSTTPGGKDPGTTNPTGNPDPKTNPTAGSLDDTATVPGAASPRRLTVLEYQNTIRDLLGVQSAAVPIAGFAADTEAALSGFVRGSTVSTSSDARALMTSTDAIGKLALDNLAKILPCSPVPTAAPAQDSCAETFITQFGMRAFRRPLAVKEVDRLKVLYKSLRAPEAGATFEQSIAMMVSAMLQTPYFLYHWELGPNAPQKDGKLIRFNTYEMASRLSYLFWASMPDDKLFEAAKAGRLTSPEQISTEARRLLADERAKEGVRDFHFQWLEIQGLVDMPKDPDFKDYSPAVAKAMAEETSQFVASIFFGPKATGKLETLLTSSTSFVDPALAKVYGMTVTGTGTREMALNPMQRAGILTQGSFLAVGADAGDSLPPRRGNAILHRALCKDLEPPQGLEIPPVADPNPMQTTRERFEVHGMLACAKSCHAFIDPVGFAFENYDAIGAYRATENNKPVDASGALALDSGTMLNFKNAIELVGQLAKAPETRDCMAKQWLRYALRRKELPTEEPSLAAIGAAFKSANLDMRELMVALTKTRAFTHRTLSAGEVAQ